jgi:two-component system sensor histidine kinase KdpD
VLASVLAVAAYDFLFVPPYFTFRVDDSQYLATFVGIVALAVMTSRLMLSVRYQARVAEHRERRASVLYAVAREMAAARSEEEVMRILVRHVCAEFGSRNAVLMPDANGRILLPHGRRMEESLRDADTSVAQWVYDHNEMAGQGTYTLAGAKAVYFPIASNDQAIGVLAMLPLNLRRVFLPEQRKLLDAFLGQAVQAIERVRLAEQAREASVQVEGEHLRNSLLSSISHDLRTPLATIVGSAATLADAGTELECEAARELGRAIHEEAQRMVSLVNNILDMARLDAGAVRMNRQWHVLDDIVGAVLTRLQRRLEGRQVNVKLPPESTLIHVDAVMIEQVLANLLENAARYTPPGSDIEISAERSAFAVTVSVADRGPGIPHGQEEQLFEKFYRVRQEGAQSGAGLGLSICKAIVEAHGGWIQANNRGSGGAVFSFLLPVEQAPPLVEEEEA